MGQGAHAKPGDVGPVDAASKPIALRARCQADLQPPRTQVRRRRSVGELDGQLLGADRLPDHSKQLYSDPHHHSLVPETGALKLPAAH